MDRAPFIVIIPIYVPKPTVEEQKRRGTVIEEGNR